MEEADGHQLSKTVDLLSTVHNVKQVLIRIFLMILHSNVYVTNSVMKQLMEEADAHQLSKTVDLLSTVHNVKQALFRIFLMILYSNVYVI
jgi:hypothetical protein